MNSPQRAQFVELLSRHQSQLYGFICAMVRDRNDAQDLLQQTLVVLWKKFDQFEPGTNFLAWAFRCAELEVRHFRSARRASSVDLSEAALSRVAEVMYAEAERAQLDLRAHALGDCLDKLNATDRSLVEQIYTSDKRVQQVARETGRLPQSVSNSLRRIRLALFDCIERRLSIEGERT